MLCLKVNEEKIKHKPLYEMLVIVRLIEAYFGPFNQMGQKALLLSPKQVICFILTFKTSSLLLKSFSFLMGDVKALVASPVVNVSFVGRKEGCALVSAAV